MTARPPSAVRACTGIIAARSSAPTAKLVSAHPEWGEEILLEVVVQRLAGHLFDDQAEPVGVDAVLPPGAGIGLQRSVERGPQTAEHVRGAGDLVILRQLRAHEEVPMARRVGEEVADRRLRLRRPQARLVAVPPVEHLQVVPGGQDRADLVVEAELAPLDELQRGDAGQGLGHRRHAEPGVRLERRHRSSSERVEPPAAMRSGPVTVDDDRDRAGHGSVRHRGLEHHADRLAQRLVHRSSSRRSGPRP